MASRPANIKKPPARAVDRHSVGGEVDADDLGTGILGGTDILKDKERPSIDDASPMKGAYAYSPETGE